MDSRLHDVARARGGVFSAVDAARAGATSSELHGLVRSGEVVRIRRGAFVLGEAYKPADVDERYRLRVRAVMRSRSRFEAASHHAALALHDIDLYAVDRTRIDIASVVSRPRVRAGVATHPAVGWPAELVRGTRAVAVETALVHTAAASGVVAGLCAMDDALHDGICTVPGLVAAVESVAPLRRGRARAAIDLADPACESVGETRTRLLLRDLGLGVRSQVRLADAAGFVARVDFVVDDLVVVEFDGLVKYAGADGRVALAAEKARESRLVDLGYEVVRIVWSELDDPAAVARRIRVARARALARRAAMTDAAARL